MTDATRRMIREWLAADGNDIERTARWMAYTLKIAGIRECRDMIVEATR